jgi:uncharacterized protein (TIGR02246 family)
MRIWISIVAILGIVSGTSWAQDTAADEEALDELHQSYKQAWENRDAAAIAALYTEDADTISETGEVASGRMAIQEAIQKELAEVPEGAHLELEHLSTQFVRPTVAVADGTWEVTGIPAPPEGQQGMPTKGLYTVVLVKQDGTWRVAASRGRIPMMPPGSTE